MDIFRKLCTISTFNEHDYAENCVKQIITRIANKEVYNAT